MDSVRWLPGCLGRFRVDFRDSESSRGIMNPHTEINRRDFVRLGALAAGAAVLPSTASAAPNPTVGMVTLPELGYSYDALEPHLDARTMEIHHTKHHAAYVAKLNDALKAMTLDGSALDRLLTGLPQIGDETLRATIRNHGGGHWNHAFFWQSMAPAGKCAPPSDRLGSAIQSTFGSMDEFKKAFAQAAASRFGSGWAWLILKDGALKITSTANQDNPRMSGVVAEGELGVPLLGLDVWEHAYYLHYQNRRADYISAWWNVVDWGMVSQRHLAGA